MNEPAKVVVAPTKEINLTPAQIERFWSRVEKTEGGCWLWTHRKDKNGYGVLSTSQTAYKAHRVAWTLKHRQIPSGMLICHDCPSGDNPSCCNPDHLFLGTNADNSADMIAKSRMAKNANNGAVKYPERLWRGEKNQNAKLTEEQVVETRKRYAEGFSISAIAAVYRVSRPVIRAIVSREAWAHVT